MFIGRKQEMRDLNAFWGRDHGVLITCRGRRRIGKSTLIAEFASQSAQTFISTYSRQLKQPESRFSPINTG